MPFRICPPGPWIHSRHTRTIRPLTQCRAVSRGSKQWTQERLQDTTKYPLSTLLYEKEQPQLSKRTGNRPYANIYMRTQIVSPDLCDDVLRYIGPSLEKHKGCDILDLNPGACLWSQKLHKFLQPRSHVLLEPAPELFKDFLNPLLDRRGSKYKLVTGDPCLHDTYRNMVNDGIFPHQKRINPNDAGLPEQNNSLLVTGSLMWNPKLPGIGFDSMAKQLLTHYTSMAWKHDIFHAFGPARMLLWFQNEDFKTCLPRSELHIGKSSFLLQKLSNVREIVQPVHSSRRSGRDGLGREPRYELESLIGAMKASRENGMELPAHRRENIHDFADDVERMSNGTGIISIAECLEYLKNQVRNGKVPHGMLTETSIESYQADQALGYLPKEKTAHKDLKGTKTEAKRASRYRAAVNHNDKLKLEKDPIVDIGEAVYNLERQILGMTSQSEKDPVLRELKRLNEELERRVRNRESTVRQQVGADMDARLSLRSPVPRLLWDKRPFEPLVMQEDEVWPQSRVSLADIEPRPIPEGQNAETLDYLQDFVFGLFYMPGAPVAQALEKMQHGASELVDQVPALRDPARGGRLDMNHLRVRMLTVEMVDGLCKAYREWPFRAPDSDHARYFRMKIGAKK